MRSFPMILLSAMEYLRNSEVNSLLIVRMDSPRFNKDSPLPYMLVDAKLVYLQIHVFHFMYLPYTH